MPRELVNTLGRPVYVYVNGEPARLREHHGITVAEMPRLGDQRTGEFCGPRGAGGAAVSVYDAASTPICVIGELPRIEGICWLVTADDIARYPHRDDFVRPACWASGPDSRDDNTSQLPRRRSILTSVAFGPTRPVTDTDNHIP